MSLWPSGFPLSDFEALYHNAATGTFHVGPTNWPDPTRLTPRGHVIQVFAVALTRDEFSWPEPRSICDPIPGYEFSGYVVSAPIASPFKPGTHVFGFTAIQRHGNARSYTVASFSEMSVQPPALSWEQCAAIPMSSLQAFQALFDSGILVKPHSAGPAVVHPFPSLSASRFAALPERNRATKLLITGAASAVGQWAVQLARQFGCPYLVATCSKDDMEHVRRLGANDVLDWDTPEGSLKDWKRSKFRAVLDCIGGNTLVHAWSCVEIGGIIASVVESPRRALSRWKGPLSGIQPMIKAYWAEVEPNQSALEIISTLLSNGHLKFHHDPADNFDLKDYEKALERLKTNARGKVVLRINTQSPTKMIRFLKEHGDVKEECPSDDDDFVDEHICDEDCIEECALDRMMDEGPDNAEQDKNDDEQEATQHISGLEKWKGVGSETGNGAEAPGDRIQENDVEMQDADGVETSDQLLDQLQSEIITLMRRRGIPAEPGIEDTLDDSDKEITRHIRTVVHQLEEDKSGDELPILQTLSALPEAVRDRLRESERMRRLFALAFYEFVHNSPPADDVGTADLDLLPALPPPTLPPPPPPPPPSHPPTPSPPSSKLALLVRERDQLPPSPPVSPSLPTIPQGQQIQQSSALGVDQDPGRMPPPPLPFRGAPRASTEMPPPPLPLSRQQQPSPGAVLMSARPQRVRLPPIPEPCPERRQWRHRLATAPPSLAALRRLRTGLVDTGLTEAEGIAVEQLQSLGAIRSSEENEPAPPPASLNPPESGSSAVDIEMGEAQDDAMSLDPPPQEAEESRPASGPRRRCNEWDSAKAD